MPSSILIVDDEPKFCEILSRTLARDGHRAVACTSPLEAINALRSGPFDMLLTDLRMPEMGGVELIAEAKRLHPSIDAVMITAFATAETAIEAMKLGALDYLIKPYEVAQLRRIIETAEATRHDRRQESDDEESTDETSLAGATDSALPRSSGTADTDPSIDRTAARPSASTSDGPIARSQAMLDLLSRANKVAPTDSSVLISGESGTGKEVLARHIHARSRRAKKPLVIVNCGAIPETLIESELFGHVRGAFTGAVDSRRGYFEAADQGTLFLDEIGELPLHLQVKLLRALQDGHVQRVGDSKPIRVDVRVLAATNRNLEQSVAAGTFRQDLYFRLNVIPMNLPPLRERPEDIDALADFFLSRHGAGRKGRLKLSADARRLLRRYDYPGNVRELENAIEHACVLAEGSEIQPDDLPDRIARFTGRAAAPAATEVRPGGAVVAATGPPAASPWGATPAPHAYGSAPPSTLEATERQMILDALAANRYNLSRSADYLGITRRTLGYRIHKHGLEHIVEEGKARAYPRRPPTSTE